MRLLGLYPTLVLLCVAPSLPGCSGLAASSNSDVVQDETVNVNVNWADYEDFSADRYSEEAPSPRPEIVHDLPSELLQEGSGSGQSFGEQSGFRISILSAVDPLDADRAAAAATAWWQSIEEKGELEAVYDVQEWEPPVYQDYRAPYYRVRIGNFASRADAQRMLDVVEDRFPNAFIVPDQVIIR